MKKKKSAGSFAVYGEGEHGNALSISYKGKEVLYYKLDGRHQDPWYTEMITSTIHQTMDKLKMSYKDILVLQEVYDGRSTFDICKPRLYINMVDSMLEEIIEGLIIAMSEK
jgi:hypothetical protein